MQLKPLQQWICDGCGQVIEAVSQGYLEWVDTPSHGSHGFRIVHHASYSPRHPNANCYKYTTSPGRMDLHLDSFVGPTGMVTLLSLLDPGPLHTPDFKGPEVSNVREWAEVFRRLHVPYYEEARLYWDSASMDRFFDGANEVWIYLPKTSNEIIERYGVSSATT